MQFRTGGLGAERPQIRLSPRSAAGGGAAGRKGSLGAFRPKPLLLKVLKT
jgi:hypothetical protein